MTNLTNIIVSIATTLCVADRRKGTEGANADYIFSKIDVATTLIGEVVSDKTKNAAFLEVARRRGVLITS